MEEIKDSGIEWVGKIPKDWDVIRCKYISTFLNGYAFDSTDLQMDFMYPVIRIGDIKNGGIDTINCQGVNNNYDIKDYLIKENDILLAMSGATVGKVGIAHNIENAYINQRVGIIRTDCPSYLFYCLSTKEFVEYILLSANGSAQPNVSANVYREFSIPLPPKEIKIKIAAFLDKKCAEIDILHSDIEKQIETLEEYKKSIITEAVTKGLNPDAEMKDSGIEWIGMIPKHWKVMRTKYASENLSKGNGITKDEVKNDGNIQCIRYGEIYSKYDSSISECFSKTNKELIPSPKYISKGDILFAGTGELVEEIGKNVVYMGDDDCLAGGDIIVMKHNQNPIFFNYALSSAYSQAQKSKGKAKLKVVHISATDIGNIFVTIPPKEEQQKIATLLEKKCFEINTAIKDKKEQLETLEQYKKSLIYEYVTGKKEVPDNE